MMGDEFFGSSIGSLPAALADLTIAEIHVIRDNIVHLSPGSGCRRLVILESELPSLDMVPPPLPLEELVIWASHLANIQCFLQPDFLPNLRALDIKYPSFNWKDRKNRRVLKKLLERGVEVKGAPLNLKLNEPSLSLYDALLRSGLPEQTIESNKELWKFINDIEENLLPSKNQSFRIKDGYGNRLFLKISTDKKKVALEATLNHSLSQQLDFIVPTRFPEPLEANGFYLTLQDDVSADRTRMPLDYWISAFSRLHQIPLTQPGSIISADRLLEEYARAGCSFRIDHSYLRDAVCYLENADCKVFTHGDAKPENLLGRYLVDLEDCGLRHPCVDLAMLFHQYQLPSERWRFYLHQYDPQRTDELHEAMGYASLYVITKEVVGSALRRKVT